MSPPGRGQAHCPGTGVPAGARMAPAGLPPHPCSGGPLTVRTRAQVSTMGAGRPPVPNSQTGRIRWRAASIQPSHPPDRRRQLSPRAPSRTKTHGGYSAALTPGTDVPMMEGRAGEDFGLRDSREATASDLTSRTGSAVGPRNFTSRWHPREPASGTLPPVPQHQNTGAPLGRSPEQEDEICRSRRTNSIEGSRSMP